ncbi:MAG: hypothetical protein Q7T54_04010 [Candidatus Levybacteria bacterium]|nr:hypothetical protein [Candidatus Levybacteria bacterium]
MEKFSKKEKVIITLIIVLVPLLLGSLFFITPWYGDINVIDEGQMGAWANHMLHGKLMYKDIYITYGPFYVYPIYVIFKLIGPEAFYVRLFYGSVGTSLGIAALLLFISRFNLKKIIFYPLFILLVFIPGVSIRQGVIFFFLWLILEHSNRKFLYNFLSGITLACCFLITPEAGIIAGFAVFLLYGKKLIFDKNLKTVFLSLLSFIAGLMVLSGLFVAWAQSEGWLGSYISTTRDVLQSFSGSNLPNGKGFPNPLDFFVANSPSIGWVKYIVSKDMLLYYQFLLFMISFLYLVTRKLLSTYDKRDNLLLLITLTGYIHYYSLVGRTGNFFLALTPTIIILAYFAQKLLLAIKRNGTRTQLGLLILILLITGRILYIFIPSLQNLKGLTTQFERKQQFERLGPVTISFEQEVYFQLIRNYVERNTTRNDYVYFLSNEPIMYLLVDRVNPSRYDLPYIAHSPEKRYELLNALKLNSPKLIFYDTVSWPVDEVSNKKRLPEIIDFINDYYNKSYIGNGRIEVYTLKDEK